jgi:hypothetical protein
MISRKDAILKVYNLLTTLFIQFLISASLKLISNLELSSVSFDKLIVIDYRIRQTINF